MSFRVNAQEYQKSLEEIVSFVVKRLDNLEKKVSDPKLLKPFVSQKGRASFKYPFYPSTSVWISAICNDIKRKHWNRNSNSYNEINHFPKRL